MDSNRFKGCIYAVSCLITCIVSLSLTAQPTSDAVALARKHAARSNALHHTPDSSMFYARLALPVLAEAGLHAEEILLRNGMGHHYLNSRDTLNWESNAHYAYELANDHLAVDHEQRLEAANNFGLVIKAVYQDYYRSSQLMERTLEASTEAGSPNLRGGLSYAVGNNYFTLGDFLTAEKYYVAATHEYRKQPLKLADKIVTAGTESCRALTAMGRYKEASAIAEDVLVLALKHKKLVPARYIYRCRIHLAESHRLAGQPELARELLLQLTADSKASAGQKADAWYQLAMAGLAMDDLPLVRKCVPEIQTSSGSAGIKAARTLHLRSRLAFIEEKQTLAFELLDRAENALGTQMEGDPLTTTLSAFELGRIINERARWLAEKRDAASTRKAIAEYLRLGRLNDLARNDYQSKDAQLLLLNGNKEVYEDALNAVYALYTKEPRPSLLDTAFYFIEKSKSTLLLDEIMARAAADRSQGAGALLDGLYAARAKLSRLRMAATSSNKNNTNILDKEREVNQLQDTLYQRFPAFANLARPTSPSLAEARTRLVADDGVLLDFFAGERWIYVLRITPKTTTLDRFPAANYSAAKIREFNENLKLESVGDISNFTTSALRMQQELIGTKDWSPGINRLVISPDGALNFLPFASLLTKAPIDGDFSFPYLLLRCRIRLVYAAAAPEMGTSSSESGNGMLGIYPIFSGQGREQKEIERVLPNLKPYEGNRLRDSNATRSAVLKELPHYEVALFATHARALDEKAGEPSISLSDGELLPADLAGRRLATRLAILSACETAVGREEKGEGVMSLSRSFTYAGVHSVVMTLWSVPEQSTMKLVVNLLGHLSHGKEIDEALRQAQILYLEDPSIPQAEKSPFHFLGMVVIGDTRPVSLTQRTNVRQRIVVGIALLVLIALVGLWLFRWRKAKTPISFEDK